MPILLFYFLGYIVLFPDLVILNKENHLLHYKNKDKSLILGDVLEINQKDFRSVAVLDNIEIEGQRIKGRLRLSIGGINRIKRGDRIQFFSRISQVRNFNNPHGFDYRSYLNLKKIYKRSYINGKKIKLIKKGDKSFIDNLRAKASSLIEKADGNKDSKSILKAVITGNKNISGELRDTFNRTGTGHLLAVSGLHMGIIAGFMIILTRFLLSFLNSVLIDGRIRIIASLAALPAVLIYGLLCGMSPSTQRASLMVASFVAALILGKESDLLNLIAAAAMIILIIDPGSLFSISFQLSFAAVIFILLSLELDLHGKNSVIKGKIKGFVIITLFATLGTAPLIIHYFGQISLVSLPSNIIVVPFFTFIIIPFGLFGVLTGFINEYAGIFILKAVLKFIEGTTNIAVFFSELKYSALLTVKPDLFETVLFYLIILSIFGLLKTKGGKAFIITTSLFISILTIDCIHWMNERYFKEDVRITFLDVGQGSSALIELPRGKTILIDGGGYSNNRYFDMGKLVVAPLLQSKKILTIDTMVLSHANSDHLNGLIYVAKNFNVKRLWSNGEASDTISYRKLMDTVKKRGILHEVCTRFKRYNFKGGKVEVLYPLSHGGKNPIKNDLNFNSLVLKLSYGQIKVLFPGDIEKPSEKELVFLSKNDLVSRILLLPHHGSDTSSTAEFLNAVGPEIAVISCGYRNRYGFPGKKVVERLEGSGVKSFRTDLDGAVIFDIKKNYYNYKICNRNPVSE